MMDFASTDDICLQWMLSVFKSFIRGVAMKMRLSDALSMTGGDKLLQRHRRRTSLAPLLDVRLPALTGDLAGASEDPSPPIDLSCTMSAATALARMEVEEEKSIQIFLIAYISFVFFLAILFVFVCIPR